MEEEHTFDQAAQFLAALAASGGVKDADLLQLYGLFKQATEGPCTTPKPGLFDLKSKAKWAAWQALGDLPPAQARRVYVSLLGRLCPEWQEAAAPGGSSSGPSSSKGAAGGIGGPVQSRMADAGEDAQVADGTTPLIGAAAAGDEAAVRQLLGQGQHPDQRDSEACTALHWAADKGHLGVLRVLLEHKAGVDVVDGDLLTPLHYAALAEQRAAAECLVQAGATLGLRSREGQTAAELAPASWTFLRTGD